MSQLLKVRVSTYDTECEYTVKAKTSGQSLFDQVVQTIGVREVWFFGLEHKTSKGQTRWLDLSKRISKQDIKRDAILKFEFKVKFFPEDVNEIIQEKTLKLFYQQVKADILSSALFATADKCVLLASYAAQVRHGDYDESKVEGYLANDKILPKDVIDKHTLKREEWEQKVTTFHKNHLGVTKEEAMLEYLKLVQDLEMYGIAYFPVVNKRGTQVLMGIDSRGINVYNKDDKLNPTISFPWSEVAKVKPTKTSLKVKLVAKQSPTFSVKASEPLLMTDLAVGNHNLFVRRRDPKETLEIQQMKRERDEKRLFEKTQNEKLKKEMAEKRKSQAAAKEFEEKFMAMQVTMDEYRKKLEDAQERIAELEQQLKETNDSKQTLVVQQEELRVMLATLERDNELGAAQKEELLVEIAKKQLEIEESQILVAAKEEEAEKLRLEMKAANEEIKETNQKIHEVLMAPPPLPAAATEAHNGLVESSAHEDPIAEEEAVAEEKALDEAEAAVIEAVVEAVAEVEAVIVEAKQDETTEEVEAIVDAIVEEKLEAAAVETAVEASVEAAVENAMVNGHNEDETVHVVVEGGMIESRRDSLASNVDPETIPTIVVSPEELEKMEVRDREADKNIEDLTKDLRAELAAVRDESVPTSSLEKIAIENDQKGRNKFKTLREIRSGHTKRRIDSFENM